MISEQNAGQASFSAGQVKIIFYLPCGQVEIVLICQPLIVIIMTIGFGSKPLNLSTSVLLGFVFLYRF